VFNEDTIPPAYVMDREHWQITGVRDFERFFQALPSLAPVPSLVAIAGGALASELREALRGFEQEPDSSMSGILTSEFHRAVCVPASDTAMRALIAFAREHAEPESGMFFALFTAAGPILEWYDAPDDPISVILQIPEQSVASFAGAAGGTYQRSD